MIHLSDAYDAFSYYFVSPSLILSLMKLFLIKILKMMVPVPGLSPVRAFLRFWNYQLIVLVDCHVMESPNLFVVSVEYFQFPAQKLL